MIDTLQLLEELKGRTGYTLPTRVIGVLGELITREENKIHEHNKVWFYNPEEEAYMPIQGILNRKKHLETQIMGWKGAMFEERYRHVRSIDPTDWDEALERKQLDALEDHIIEATNLKMRSSDHETGSTPG